MSNSSFLTAANLGGPYFQEYVGGFTPDIDTSFGIDQLGAAFEGPSSVAMGTSPAKPGFGNSFADALIGGTALIEGVGNLIRGIRGMDPVPGMAGSRMQQYAAQQRDEDRLNKLLAAIGKPKDDSSSVLASALLQPSLKTDNPLRGLG
jgi:hypothetical protein